MDERQFALACYLSDEEEDEEAGDVDEEDGRESDGWEEQATSPARGEGLCRGTDPPVISASPDLEMAAPGSAGKAPASAQGLPGERTPLPAAAAGSGGHPGGAGSLPTTGFPSRLDSGPSRAARHKKRCQESQVRERAALLPDRQEPFRPPSKGGAKPERSLSLRAVPVSISHIPAGDSAIAAGRGRRSGCRCGGGIPSLFAGRHAPVDWEPEVPAFAPSSV